MTSLDANLALKDDKNPNIDDMSLLQPAQLRSTNNSPTFWIITDGDNLTGDLAEVDVTTGDVKSANTLPLRPGLNTSFGIAADGTSGLFLGSPLNIRVRDLNDRGLKEFVDAPFAVGALAFTEEGELVVGGHEDARIDQIRSDNEFRRLLGPAGDSEAMFEAGDELGLGPIVSLHVLPDERVVFVSDTSAGRRLFVLDDSNVRQVGPDAPDVVQAEDTETPPLDSELRGDRRPIDPITVTADGRVVAVGQDPDRTPVIRLVDVDTGDVEVLAELEGVEPTIEEPVSAVLVQDDLIFLAEGQLWKLEDAVR